MLTRRQAGRGLFGFAYDDRERERERCLLGHSIADTFELFGTVGNSYTIMKLWIYMRWNNYNWLCLIAGSGN